MKLLIKQTTLLRHSAIYSMIIFCHRKLLQFNTAKSQTSCGKNITKPQAKQL